MIDILPRPEGGAIEGAQLAGRHAVVTGATRGIGRAIAEALGKSEDAIKAQLYRIRRTIADGTPGLEVLLKR